MSRDSSSLLKRDILLARDCYDDCIAFLDEQLELYDLSRDPFELVNLVRSSPDNQAVGAFRKMLLDVLTENPASIEVDKVYLEAYKKGLKALIPESSPRRVAGGH